MERLCQVLNIPSDVSNDNIIVEQLQQVMEQLQHLTEQLQQMRVSQTESESLVHALRHKLKTLRQKLSDKVAVVVVVVVVAVVVVVIHTLIHRATFASCTRHGIPRVFTKTFLHAGLSIFGILCLTRSASVLKVLSANPLKTLTCQHICDVTSHVNSLAFVLVF